MPDYNRPATVYWWLVVAAGSVALAHAMWWLTQQAAGTQGLVLAGMAIAMTAGFFPVRVAHSKNAFTAGEIFIFLLLLMHGPQAALLAAAGEALVGSFRASRRWTSRLASPAMAALAMLAAGSALQAVRHATGNHPGLLVVLAMLLAVSYFALNTLLVTGVARLKRGEWWTASDLFAVFGWVGIAYAGSGTVAVLLFLTYEQTGLDVLAATVPLLGMLLATLHYFFRQQEAADAVRQSAAEAAERERELAARHVRELEASERRFHSAFTHASIGMALLGFDGRVLQANDALRELLGLSDPALLGHDIGRHVHPEDQAALQAALAQVGETGGEDFALEMRCQHQDGHSVWVAAHGARFSEPDSDAPCLILQTQDISARRAAEAGLHHIAFHDSLTGLPNRRRFHELLAQAVERANAAEAGQADAFAVMFLDFDRFKLINDSLGHSAGDDFLVQVARRISGCLRPSDVVARLGGDEFAVLLLGLEHDRIALSLADRLLEALKQPYLVAGTAINSSASIGITFSSFGPRNTEDVLRDADTAMYKAKGAGKARYALFDASLHTEVAKRLRLEGDLRRAIDAGQLSVAYQPIYDLEAGRISGFEALARWHHGADGDVSPATFIPIAEETGLIQRVSDFVLNCACHQLARWQALDPAFAELTMSVNVSGNDVAHSGFVGRVTRALVEAGLNARHLTLELTENILMARLEAALPMLGELRQLGVTLAVDDFGTGYSSLSHLSTLPIDTLKIDRSFVQRLDIGSKEAAVVRAIALLGLSLGKTIVAEGVETSAQAEQLREMGCQLGQGYHLGKPMPADTVTALLQDSVLLVPAAAAEGVLFGASTRPSPLLH
jgi:diguanylate cyclase (GGDEF)-like protein/PAS domain S-box-containing protein